MTPWQRLLFVLTSATHDDLVRKIQFLMVQVDILQGKLPKRITVIRDLDGKYSPDFDAALRAASIEPVPVGPRKPVLNAFAERFVLTIKSECLNHFVVLGEDHLRYLVDEFVDGHYNRTRPHQGVGNLPLAEGYEPPTPQAPSRAKEVLCEQRLGGLLKHYHLAAAA
jgi:hypothetical protein